MNQEIPAGLIQFRLKLATNSHLSENCSKEFKGNAPFLGRLDPFFHLEILSELSVIMATTTLFCVLLPKWHKQENACAHNRSVSKTKINGSENKFRFLKKGQHFLPNFAMRKSNHVGPIL